MRISYFILAFSLSLTSSLSAATINSFTGPSSWLGAEAALGLQTNMPLPLSGLVQTGGINVVSEIDGNGVTVTPLGATQLVVADQNAEGYDFGASQVFSAQLGFPSAVALTLAPGTFGVAFDVGAFPSDLSTTDLTAQFLTASGTQTIDFSGLGGPAGLTFEGFTSDQQILSVSLTAGPADPVFANLMTATDTPEPSTIVMLALGCTALVIVRRRLVSN
jgi:hypothetical protein